MATSGDAPASVRADDADLGPIIGPYECEGDMDAALPIMEKHGLTFG